MAGLVSASAIPPSHQSRAHSQPRLTLDLRALLGSGGYFGGLLPRRQSFSVAVLAFLFGYPALFPGPLSQPAFNVDSAEGKVWINSAVVVEVRGHLTAEAGPAELEFDPPVELSEHDSTSNIRRDCRGTRRSPGRQPRVTINAAAAHSS